MFPLQQVWSLEEKLPCYLEEVNKAKAVRASVSGTAHEKEYSYRRRGPTSGKWSKSCCISCRNICFIFT
ncbi:hypothetical protein V6N11_058506 [Hibiscus sabdariffa]|uniref:Uncharacterized protein n=1 Tax=Hibiscus sabdariffa TaxID=183260 RepID=A0ABR2U4P5_9ROSI